MDRCNRFKITRHSNLHTDSRGGASGVSGVSADTVSGKLDTVSGKSGKNSVGEFERKYPVCIAFSNSLYSNFPDKTSDFSDQISDPTRLAIPRKDQHFLLCFAHRLNVVVLDVVHELQPIFECLALLQKLYNFVSCATIHPIWVHLQEERKLKVMELKAISETRWSCQSNMLSTVCSRIDVLFELLEIGKNQHHKQDKKDDAKSSRLMSTLPDSIYISMTESKLIFSMATTACKTLLQS